MECMTGEIKRRGGLPVSSGSDSSSGDSGAKGTGGGSKTVVRNGGQSNVGLGACALTFHMSGHDAAVCQSGYAAHVWAMEYKVEGYVTVDIGEMAVRRRTRFPEPAGTARGTPGLPTSSCGPRTEVYIWERSNPGSREYGEKDGPNDLTR